MEPKRARHLERRVTEGALKKFSMGRSFGIKPQNWKSRYFKITSQYLTIFKSYDNNSVQFECPLSAISIVFAQPTPQIHKECTSNGANNAALMFALRLFDNGVYTLLVQASSPEEKAHWIAALASAIMEKHTKGFQLVE
jgi:hypothetical protein